MNNQKLILDVNQHPKGFGKWLLLAIQHLLAMLVACITVPTIINTLGSNTVVLPVGATIAAAGLGTLFYLVVTKFKSPVFLSSSFAYLSPMITVATTYGTAEMTQSPVLGLIIGTAIVGLIYLLVAIVVKITGVKWLNKLLPPVVIGPVIMVIGLSLAGSAMSNMGAVDGSENYNLWFIFCGLVSMIVTAVCAHFGKKTLSTIPFIMGILAGYLVAALLTVTNIAPIINFDPLVSLFKEINLNTFINTGIWNPESADSVLFLRDWDAWKNVDLQFVSEIALLFAPVALVTICEHIGDHKNLSNIIDKDLLENPGLHRTLIGDGVATSLSGGVCGAANTSYGENVGVIAVTKIASVSVVVLAAFLSVVVGFFRPFTVLLETIPGCVCGGVSMVLYGFIANSGVKLLIKEKVDFEKTRNVFIAAVILVAGIGGMTLNFGPFKVTSIAIAMILGIILNLILREKPSKEVPLKEILDEALPEVEPTLPLSETIEEEQKLDSDEPISVESSSYVESLVDTLLEISSVKFEAPVANETESYTTDEQPEVTPVELTEKEITIDERVQSLKLSKFGKRLSKTFKADEIRDILTVIDVADQGYKKLNIVVIEGFIENHLDSLTKNEIVSLSIILGQDFKVNQSWRKQDMIDKMKLTLATINNEK